MRTSRRHPALMPALALAVGPLLATGCWGDAPRDAVDTSDPGAAFDHEPLPLSCESTFPVSEVFPLGADEDAFLIAARSDDSLLLSRTSRAGLTRDGGRTLAAIPIHSFASGPDTTLTPNQLGGRRDVAALDADFFSSMHGMQTGNDSQHNPLYRTMVVDGEGTTVGPSPDPADVPGGRADVTWRADATHWMARRGYRLWATRDAGASWHDAGLVPYLNAGPRAKFFTLGRRGDAVLIHEHHEATNPGPYYLVEGDAAPVEVPISGVARGYEPHDATMRFWGERLVFLDGARFWVSGDRGSTWSELANAERGYTYQFDAVEASDGALYVVPIADLGDIVDPAEKPVRIYRYAPGASEPVIMDTDLGPLEIAAMTRPVPLSGGRLRLVVHPKPTREAYSGILCLAGPGVTPHLGAATVEPLEVAATSDRVVRIARLKDLGDVDHRFAVSPRGRAFAGAWQAVMALPWDAPTLYSATHGSLPHEDLGVLPQAILPAFGDWLFGAILYGDPKPTALGSMDARTGLTQARSLGMTQAVHAAHATVGGTLLRTESGTMLYTGTGAGTTQANWPNGMITDGLHGAVLSNVAYDRLVPQLAPAYMVRFVPWREPVPDLGRCNPTPPAPLPAECEPLPEMSVLAAEYDADGNLYALDAYRSRVLMLPAGESGADRWVELATGFLSPTDLLVRRVADRWVVLVYDGDVFAFGADPTRTKVRGAGELPARRDAPVVAARDLHDCTASGPCLDDSIDFVDLTRAPPACLAGRDLGATAGRVFAGAVELTVTSWSETEVCLATSGASLIDGLLQVVRADGAASNRLPFVAPGSFSRWEIPEVLYPDTPIVARGDNLGGGTVASHTMEGDLFVEWPLRTGSDVLVKVQKLGVLAERTVSVSPRVHHTCRGARAQYCTIYGAGFGTRGTATLGGLAAEVEAWSDSSVSLAWPDGLAPGVHRAVLTGESARAGTGYVVEDEVELLGDDAPLVLWRDAPMPEALASRQPRPVLTSRGLFANLDLWTMENFDGEPTPTDMVGVLVEPDVPMSDNVRSDGPVGARMTGLNTRFEPTRPVHPFEHEGELYAIGTAYRGPVPGAGPSRKTALRRLDPRTHPDTGAVLEQVPLVGEITTTDPGLVAAVGEVEGRVLVAITVQTVPYPTELVAFTLSEAAAGEVPILVEGSRVRLPHAWPFAAGRGDPATHGGFFVGAGFYLSSCRNPTAGAHLERSALSFDASGALELTTETLVDAPGARLLACNTTADGLVWLEALGELQRVWLHEPGAAPRVLVVVPASLPGARDAFDGLPGLQDVALLPDGDVLVLLNAHDAPPRGLHLARWDAQSEAWSTAHVITPATMFQRGELCVGPHTNAAACPGWARDGCSPVGCAVRPPEPVERPTTHIGEAFMVVRGDTVSIIYEAIETARLRVAAFGGSDVFHVRVPLPP